jgi:uncharacterized protein YegP (UPF0339 family)
MGDRYTVFRSNKDSQWYFRRQSGNNEEVGASEGYGSREGATTEAHREADPEGLPVYVMLDDDQKQVDPAD